MLRYITVAIAAMALVFAVRTASGQTIEAEAVVVSPTSSSYYYAQEHTYYNITVQTHHWVTISGGAANTNYSTNGNAGCGVQSNWEYYVYGNRFSITTDGNGFGNSSTLAESGTGGVFVQPGIQGYNAIGQTYIYNTPTGFTVIGTNPYTDSVTFTIAGDD